MCKEEGGRGCGSNEMVTVVITNNLIKERHFLRINIERISLMFKNSTDVYMYQDFW